MKKILLLVILIVILVGCSPVANQPGEGKEIKMAQATWDTGWFQAQIYKKLLEELGYSVDEPIILENPEFYIIAAQGNIDFWVNGWFPIHERYLEFEKVNGRVSPIGYLVKAGAIQGYLIDKKTAMEYGITNLGDLKNPEIAKLFDRDEDGKADLIGCDPGWGCELVINHHLEQYSLSETITHVQGEYSDLMMETLDLYNQGQPVLFYTWTPNWTVSQFVIDEDIMWLSVPFLSLPNNEDIDTSTEKISGCLEEPCDLGFGIADIRVVANIEFLLENPAAEKLFELVQISLGDIADQNTKMFNGEDTFEDIRRHAIEWIAANREVVDTWLEAARQAEYE